MESSDSQLDPCSGHNWGQWLDLPMVMEQGEIYSGRGWMGTTHCPALAYIKRSSRSQGVTACGLPLLRRQQVHKVLMWSQQSICLQAVAGSYIEIDAEAWKHMVVHKGGELWALNTALLDIQGHHEEHLLSLLFNTQASASSVSLGLVTAARLL